MSNSTNTYFPSIKINYLLRYNYLLNTNENCKIEIANNVDIFYLLIYCEFH